MPIESAKHSQLRAVAILLLLLLSAVVLVYFLFRQKPTLTIIGESSGNLTAMKNIAHIYPGSASTRLLFDENEFDVLQQKTEQALIAGSPVYDVILNYNFSLATYAERNWMLNADDFRAIAPGLDFAGLEQDLFKNQWEEVGHYYASGTASTSPSAPQVLGYPFAANTMLLVYNRNLFDDPVHRAQYKAQYGRDLAPPTTWPEFHDIAEYFGTCKPKKLYGLCMQGKDGGWLYYEWCNFVFGMNGSVVKGKTRGWETNQGRDVTVDSSETLRATEFWLSLKPFATDNFLSTGASEQQEILKRGTVAMAITWSDYLHGLIATNGIADDRFGFAPIPGTKSMLAGGSFYIPRTSRHKLEAVTYIHWLLSKSVQVQLMKEGLCSPLRSAYDDPEVQKIPYAKALRESLEAPRGIYMCEATPDAEAIQVALTTNLQKAWRGDVTAVQALTDAKRDIESKQAELSATK